MLQNNISPCTVLVTPVHITLEQWHTQFSVNLSKAIMLTANQMNMWDEHYFVYRPTECKNKQTNKERSFQNCSYKGYRQILSNAKNVLVYGGLVLPAARVRSCHSSFSLLAWSCLSQGEDRLSHYLSCTSQQWVRKLMSLQIPPSKVFRFPVPSLQSLPMGQGSKITTELIITKDQGVLWCYLSKIGVFPSQFYFKMVSVRLSVSVLFFFLVCRVTAKWVSVW